ncbi:MAG: 5-bromo-4-chloroindolyl phosphate hydrolysis family protein [Erysipelotrichaceae bacterium]|nr:5-bromo-4-chloroindolyl phosphate hydrolysis family protein [Erysipelotrichaceae bacterium]
MKQPEKKEEKKSFSDAGKFIDQINTLNQGLANEEVTNGLYQTCDLLKQIDIVDQEDGKVDPKLNKLYEYYLPILTGILEDYKRLSDSPIQGDDFKKTEIQLVKTIKLINEALKTIYNSLHESDYMNLNADINTLQSLLKQDGLVEAPFKGGK